eukprot:COSAG01_NODE_13816_length_1531_cov_1.289106_3_plen_156_part_01
MLSSAAVLAVLHLGVSFLARSGLGEAAAAPAPFTCGRMNSSDVYDMSYQGSWTYRELSRTKAFDTGDIFMATFSDTGGGAIFPAPLSLTPVELPPDVLSAGGSLTQQQEPPCSSLQGPFCDCKPGASLPPHTHTIPPPPPPPHTHTHTLTHSLSLS